MNQNGEVKTSRKQIGIRLLYTLLCLVILEIIKLIIQLTVVFQFVYLLITQKYSDPLKSFSNRLATYAYRVVRYATLNDNLRPFPFDDFPREMEKPQEPVSFE